MLRKFVVWFSCFVADFVIRPYILDIEQGKIFLCIHLGATIVMWLILSIMLRRDEYMIQDEMEHQIRLNEITMAQWDIAFIFIILVVCYMLNKIFDLNLYLIYLVMTFGYCFGKTLDIDDIYEYECYEDEEEENKENEKNHKNEKQ